VLAGHASHRTWVNDRPRFDVLLTQGVQNLRSRMRFIRTHRVSAKNARTSSPCVTWANRQDFQGRHGIEQLSAYDAASCNRTVEMTTYRNTYQPPVRGWDRCACSKHLISTSRHSKLPQSARSGYACNLAQCQDLRPVVQRIDYHHLAHATRFQRSRLDFSYRVLAPLFCIPNPSARHLRN
jgi:hypothetical protein